MTVEVIEAIGSYIVAPICVCAFLAFAVYMFLRD